MQCNNQLWGYSSIGRARALQARGTGIETRYLHNKKKICSISLVVRTPRCGRGNPGSYPGWSIRVKIFFFLAPMLSITRRVCIDAYTITLTPTGSTPRITVFNFISICALTGSTPMCVQWVSEWLYHGRVNTSLLHTLLHGIEPVGLQRIKNFFWYT